MRNRFGHISPRDEPAARHLPVNHLTGCLFNEYALRLRPLCSSMSCDVRRLDLRVGNVHFLPEHTQEH